MSEFLLKIGELAKLTGSQVETVRYYEREGLLPVPNRSAGNYRLYENAHVERLQFILRCRSLDMALAEVRQLLAFRDEPEKNCEVVNELIDTHVAHVSTRIAELQNLEKQLKKLRSLCRQTEKTKNCRILRDLSEPDTKKVKKLVVHGRGCH